MASPIENHRWTAEPEQFAARIDVTDVPRYFSRQLIIEPGTRALIVDDGKYVGDVGPGTHTLESFLRPLKFWRQHQATAILTRQEDFPLEIVSTDIPTAENLTVDATVRLAIQIEDVALFLRNLMGTRAELRADDLRNLLAPVVWQSLWEAIGRMSIKNLTGPENRAEIDAQLAQSISLAMRRYGLKFVRVQLVAIGQQRYDELRQRHGDNWLEREDLLADETQNELAALADKVDIDRQQDQLAAELRRIGIRNELRAAVRSEEFDKIGDVEQFEKMLHERDKNQLLREEEKQGLVDAFRQRQKEGEQTREHLLAKLELEQRMEIEQVREQLDHAARMKRLEHEIAMARQTASKENLEWQQQVELEAKQAEHRRQERDKEWAKQRQWVRQQSTARREDQWADLVHQQQAQRLEGDIAAAHAERKARVAMIESELRGALATDELETEKRRKEWERDESRRTTDDQLDKLRRTQELNAEAAQHQLELHQRRQRLDVELDVLKEDKASERELKRLAIFKGMSTEELIISGQHENAALLADLKKHESSQGTLKAQLDGSHKDAIYQERAKAQEKLDAERKAASDAMAAMYRDLLDSQNSSQHKTLDTLRDVAKGGSGQPIVFGAGQPMQPAGGNGGAKVLLCTACAAENDATARHCSNCGAKIGK